MILNCLKNITVSLRIELEIRWILLLDHSNYIENGTKMRRKIAEIVKSNGTSLFDFELNFSSF